MSIYVGLFICNFDIYITLQRWNKEHICLQNIWHKLNIMI